MSSKNQSGFVWNSRPFQILQLRHSILSFKSDCQDSPSCPVAMAKRQKAGLVTSTADGKVKKLVFILEFWNDFSEKKTKTDMGSDLKGLPGLSYFILDIPIDALLQMNNNGENLPWTSDGKSKNEMPKRKDLALDWNGVRTFCPLMSFFVFLPGAGTLKSHGRELFINVKLEVGPLGSNVATGYLRHQF